MREGREKERIVMGRGRRRHREGDNGTVGWWGQRECVCVMEGIDRGKWEINGERGRKREMN